MVFAVDEMRRSYAGDVRGVPQLLPEQFQGLGGQEYYIILYYIIVCHITLHYITLIVLLVLVLLVAEVVLLLL